MRSRGLLGALVAASAGVIVYVRWLRPYQMHWGATPGEIERSLPGDEIFPAPTWNATRAVTVAATPEEIWPWLLQIGWGRAGWYGYDWADNGFRHSSWEILGEHQHIALGKAFPMSPFSEVRCYAFEPNRWMLWRTGDSAGTWLWYLDPIDGTRTRLITRMRDRYHWRDPIALAQQLAVDLFDIFFMRKCLLGIKARAERYARRAQSRRAGEHAAPDAVMSDLPRQR